MATVRKIIATLQVMLAYAISIDLLTFNAAKEVEVIASRRDEAKRIVPPSREIMKTLIELADDSFRGMLLFAASTGLRVGEFHATRWRHIDLEWRELTIETRVNSYRDEDVPKTNAGMRTIPMGEALIEALLEWNEKTAYSKSDDLVFPNYMGEFWNHDGMVKSKWRPLFKRLQTAWRLTRKKQEPKFFNWHAMRHFAISGWIDAGLPPKTVQSFAGHSSLQVTMDRYGHLFRSDRHASAMDAIAGNMKADKKTVRPNHSNRKWSDFTPKIPKLG